MVYRNFIEIFQTFCSLPSTEIGTDQPRSEVLKKRSDSYICAWCEQEFSTKEQFMDHLSLPRCQESTGKDVILLLVLKTGMFDKESLILGSSIKTSNCTPSYRTSTTVKWRAQAKSWRSGGTQPFFWLHWWCYSRERVRDQTSGRWRWQQQHTWPYSNTTSTPRCEHIPAIRPPTETLWVWRRGRPLDPRYEIEALRTEGRAVRRQFRWERQRRKTPRVHRKALHPSWTKTSKGPHMLHHSTRGGRTWLLGCSPRCWARLSRAFVQS